ncbi:hypothetical protein MASR2M78_18310 [Treponema sp.]
MDTQMKNIYRLGAVATFMLLIGIIIDIVFGSMSSGGDLTTLPQSAVAHFEQFRTNWLLGLYNLDLLNSIMQLISIPVFFVLFLAHRKSESALALLGLVLFLVGATLFVSGNVALPMFELSGKYFTADSDAQRSLFAAAGEALLIRGSHGSFGVFFAFILPSLAGIVMSLAMLRGKVFSRLNSWLGILGGALLLCYIVLVTFFPGTKSIAIAMAMPGGLMQMAWMLLFSIRLLLLSL